MLLKLRRLSKNKTARYGALFTIFAFLNNGISFLLLILIAKYIDPVGYGYVNLSNTIVTVLGFFISLNAAGIIPVNYFKEKPEDFKKTVNAVFLITIYTTIALSVLLYVFRHYLVEVTNLRLEFLYFTIFVALSTSLSQNMLNIWRVVESVIKYGLFSGLIAVSNFFFCVFFVIALENGWEGQLYAYFISAIIISIISIALLLNYGYLRDFNIKKTTYRDCLAFGIPLIPHSLSFWLRQGLDRLIINNYLGVEIVGLFGFSYNFANILLIIGTAFNSTISVSTFQSLSTNQVGANEKLRKQTTCLIAIYMILMVLILFTTIVFIPIVFPNYSDCTSYLFPLCLTSFLQCVYLLFVNVIFFYKKTKVLMYITFGISVLHMLMSFLLTRYSVQNTLWIGVMSNLLIALSVFCYSRKIYKII